MRFLLLFVLLADLGAQTTTSVLPGSEYVIQPDPTRDPWQKPSQVIETLNFTSSQTVAVVEEGYPYFAQRIAPLVRKVYAINTDARAFQGRGQLPPTISTIVSTNSNPSVTGLGLDTIMMVDVLHSVPQRALYYAALLLGLKSGGRVVIIDRKLPSVFPASSILTDVQLQSELKLAGFTFANEFTFLPYQYFLGFQH